MKKYIWQQNVNGHIATTAAYADGKIISIHGSMGTQPIHMVGDVISFLEIPYKITAITEGSVVDIPDDEEIIGNYHPLSVKDDFEELTKGLPDISADERYAAWVLEVEEWMETLPESDLQVWFDSVLDKNVIYMRKKKGYEMFTGTSVSLFPDAALDELITILMDEKERRDLAKICPDCGYAPMLYVDDKWVCDACGND